MTSPFPGMDPFLEDPAHWSGFHIKFLNYCQEALSDVLPEPFEASLGERVYLVEHDPDARKLVYPDVALLESGPGLDAGTHTSGGIGTLAPVTLPLVLLDGPREAYIEILEKPEQTLVAVLELLSPANKENPGRVEYLAKRNALLHQNVHLIEIDLLLGGKRLPMGRPLPSGDYFCFVSRAEERFNCQVYAWRIAQTLPEIPIPLRGPHPDVSLSLAQVFNTAYERGRYRRRIDYRKPCPVVVPEPHREWAQQIAATTK